MFLPDDADESWLDMEIPSPPSRMFYLDAIRKLEEAGFTIKSHYVEETMGGHFYTEENRLLTIDITSNTVNAVKVQALLDGAVK